MRTLLLSASLLLIGLSVEANHIVGANLSYEHLDGNNYIVFLNVFQDCADPQQASNEIIRVVPSCDFGFASYFLSLSSVTEVTQAGPLDIQNSSCNGGFLPGVIRLIYTDTIQISTPCPELVLYWKKCNRNFAINIDNSNSPCFYVETVINMNYPENNSVRLSSPTVPYVCGNPDIQVNLGAYDPDGDELRYSLVPAQRPTTGNNHVDIVYEDGFSAEEPIEGMTIDPQTGSLTIDTQIIGEYVVAMLIEELDPDGITKSSMTVDVQFVVSTCSPYPPSIQGPGVLMISEVNTNLSDSMQISVCEGSEFCVSMQFASEDPDEILSVTANSTEVLPGASMSISGINPVTVDICWTASNMNGNRLLIVSVANDDIPIPTVVSYGIEIVDIGITTLDLEPEQLICGTEIILSNPLPFGMWSSEDDVDLNDLQNGTTSAMLPAIGSHQFIWDSGCVSDTITVIAYDEVVANAGIDREFCTGNTLVLQANTLGESESGTWLSDEENPGFVEFSDVNDPMAVITLEEYGAYTFYWQVDNPACQSIDDVVIRFNVTEPMIALIGSEFVLLNEDIELNYQWLLNGESIPGANSTAYTPGPEDFGAYSVLAITPGGCSSISTSITWGPTGIEEYDQSVVTVYPNPALLNGNLNIELNGRELAYIMILDSHGRITLEQALTSSFSQVDIGKMSKGLYILKVMDAQGLPLTARKLILL